MDPLYDGPYTIINTNNINAEIEINNKIKTVQIAIDWNYFKNANKKKHKTCARTKFYFLIKTKNFFLRVRVYCTHSTSSTLHSDTHNNPIYIISENIITNHKQKQKQTLHNKQDKYKSPKTLTNIYNTIKRHNA